jgi:outer membrane protein assembly factor BamB
VPARDAETFTLPATDEPLWQIRIAGPHLPGQLNPQNGVPISATTHTAPNAAIVGDRLYANWLGTVYAADLETGKMLWRTGDFIEAPKSAINYAGESSTDCFALVPSGGKLFVMRPPVTNQLGETLAADSARDVSLAIECLDAVSGKTLWRAPKLNVFVLAGPYLVDGIEYLIASGTRNELILVGIDMETGRVRIRISFGTPSNANGGGGNSGFGGPKMLASGGTLYVATNDRSLIALDLANHEVEWALEPGSSPESDSQSRSSTDGMPVTSFVGKSALVKNDGVVYFQDGSVPLLFALEPAELNVKWKRPTSVEDSIVAVDWPIAYLVGSGLSALDLKSRKLFWSTKIPDQRSMPRPLFCPDHIYMATSRGVFDIDPASGGVRHIFRGADRESSGGRLLIAGDKLICVSDTAVTAYSIQRVKPRSGPAQNR